MSDGYSHLAGSKTSVAEIYRQHGELIRKVICSRIGDSPEAEDVFQDFFLYLVANPLPDNLENVEHYLYRSVSNCIKDATLHKKRYRMRLYRYGSRLRHSDTEYHPINPIINAEESQKMFRLIGELLPSHKAAAVTQQYKNGGDIEKTAATLGINRRSASRYVCMGLQKMQQLLAVNKGAI
ncbi:MAG: sigma-70 family RNA polymerase sigma factor [Sedimentisphaerales bacterium]|nr:sigma-70 family RNA polymerase sigma factor [Sedimentisphaerales bacterium]